MGKEEQKPVDRDFEERHQEELGVGAFAKEQVLYTAVPLASLGGGFAAGFYGLSKLTAKMFLKINTSTGLVESLGSKIGGAVKSMWVDGASVQDAFKHAGVTEDKVAEVDKIWNATTKPPLEKVKEIAGVFAGKLPEVSKTVRIGTAVASMWLAGTAGGLFIAYREWKKKTGAELAAAEVNKDIANLELFRPSDPELLEENKRLRTMVAALPTVEANTVSTEGKLHHAHRETAMG